MLSEKLRKSNVSEKFVTVVFLTLLFFIIDRVLMLLVNIKMESKIKETFILFFSFLIIYFIILLLIIIKDFDEKRNIKIYTIVILFLLSLIVKIYFAIKINGFPTDVGCFIYWGDIASENIKKLYSGNVFIDYPPLYILLLGLLIKINLLQDKILLIKLIPIICDLLLSILFLFYYKNKSKLSNKEIVILVCIFYLYNPLVILDSSLWGQCDSVLLLLIVLSHLLYEKKKYLFSIVVASLSIMIKPQAIFYAIILLGVLALQAYLTKRYPLFLMQVVLFLIPFALVSILLKPGEDNLWLLKLYLRTINEYPYTSLNALNVYTILKMNWIPINSIYKVVSSVVVSVFIIFTMILYYKIENKKVDSSVLNQYMLFSVVMLYLIVFTFSIGMHERYSYIPVLLMPFVLIPKQKFHLTIFSFFILNNVFNTLAVLILSQSNQFQLYISPVEQLISLFNVILTIYLIRYWIFFCKISSDMIVNLK